MSTDIGAVIKLEGEKEFRDAVTSCNKSITAHKSELSLVKAQYEGNANSLEALQKKQEALKKIYDDQIAKQKAVKDGLDKARDTYSIVENQVAKYADELEKATAELKRLKESGDASEDAIVKQEKAVDQLESSVSKGNVTLQKAADRISDWETKANTAEAQTLRSNRALQQNEKYLNEAKKSTDHCATSIDEFGKQTKSSMELTESFGTIIKRNLIDSAADMAKEIGGNAVQAVGELQSAQGQLQASTGATGLEMKNYKSVMEDLYKSNYGESFDDVGEAMGVIRQNLGQMDASGMKEVSENAITLRDTFGMDFQEQMRAVKMLMDTFGVSADQAYNLIAQGAQKGLDKNGDLLDTINEYSVHYSQMGLTADEFFNSLANGTEAGTFSVDKLGDAYKEFGIRVKDTSTATTEAYELLGMNADQMRQKFAAGGETARQATEMVIDALFSMDDAVIRNQAGVGLFGTMWEDLGAKGVQALTNVNGSISQTKDAMESIKEVKYDNITSKYEELGRTFQSEVVTPVLENFLPAAEAGVETLSAALETFAPVIQGVGIAFAGWKVQEVATRSVSALSGFIGKLDIAKVKSLGLSAVTKGGLIGAVAATAVAAGAALVSYARNLGEASEEAKQLAKNNEKVCESANAVADEVGNAIDSYEEANLQMQAESQYAKTLADSIGELAEKERLSNAEKQVMQEYVAQLNDAVPGLNLQYDAQAETLSKTNSEIEQYLANTEKELSQQQLKEQAIALLQQKSELEVEGIKIGHQAAEISEKRNALLSEENDLVLKDITGITTWIAGKSDERKSYQELTEAQDANLEAMSANVDAKNTLMAKEEELRQQIEAAGGSWEEVTAAAYGSAEATGAAAEAAKQNASEQANAAAVMQNAADGIAETYNSMHEKVTKVLEDQMDMFDKFNGGAKISTENLLSNMKSQIDGVTNWADNLTALSDRAINQDLLTYLAEMGPQGANYVAAFASMSDEELKKANKMWEKSLDMKAGVSDSVEGMLTAYTESLNGGKKEVASVMKELGQSSVKGLAQGVNSSKKEAESAGKDIGKAEIKGSKDTLQVNSPSKVYIQIGKDTVQGLANGIKGNKSAASNAAKELAKSLIDITTAQLKPSGFSKIGKAVSDGISTGIQSGRGAVERTASDLCKTLVSDTTRNLPPEKFKGIGKQITAGVTSGIQTGSSGVRETASNLAGKIVSDIDKNLASKKFQSSGKQIPSGIASGIRSGKENAYKAASDLAAGVKNRASKIGSLYSTGQNLSYGMASGIRAGRSSVINAVASVCSAAVAEARSKLKIHSPSKVFEELGAYTAEGFGIGYKNEIADVKRLISESMSYKAADNSVQQNGYLQIPEKLFRLELPIYVGNQYTRTEIIEIAMDGISRYQENKMAVRGVFVDG